MKLIFRLIYKLNIIIGYFKLLIQCEIILSLYSTADVKALHDPPQVEDINALLDLDGIFNVLGKRTCQPLISFFDV